LSQLRTTPEENRWKLALRAVWLDTRAAAVLACGSGRQRRQPILACGSKDTLPQLPPWDGSSSWMIHGTRIIPLDGRPHLPSNVRLWLGDSVGRWDGSTLVVDTANFNDAGGFYGDAGGMYGSDRNLHVVERFSLLDADTILYRFEVDDEKMLFLVGEHSSGSGTFCPAPRGHLVACPILCRLGHENKLFISCWLSAASSWHNECT
jgi:hypothetical protein